MNGNAPARLMLAAALLLGACGGDDEPGVDASTEPDARPPVGTMSATWQLEDSGGGVSCEDAGAQLVVVEMVRQGEGAGEADTFNCTTGEASTRAVQVGIYDLRFDLVDAAAQSLVAEQVSRFGIEVSEDADTPIGEIVFELK
jgi:hypothetical protein